MYECLVGYPPFYADDPMSTCRKIVAWKRTLVFPDEVDISVIAKDLIEKLITDVKGASGRSKRLKFDQMAEHPFFKGVDWKNIRSTKAVIVPTVEGPTDTQNFDDFEEEDQDIDDEKNDSSKQNDKVEEGKSDESFIGYTFKRPEETTKMNNNFFEPPKDDEDDNDNDSDSDDFGVYSYDTQESLESVKSCLADRLETKILEIIKDTYQEEFSTWALRNTMKFVIPDLIRLSEDEPYGVKGANIILKFSKLQDKHDGHQSPSKFSKLRRSSNISSCSTSSEHDGFEGAVTIGDFKICNDTVSTFELVLILKEEKRDLGQSIRNWLSHLTGSKKINEVSSEFSLTKRKLYRMST
jgi:hypothetical protein